MATPFIAQIQMFSFGFAPRNWAQCNGQLLPINQNQALFSLIGTLYGGNGTTNFALPNLQGRTPLHFGTGPGLSTRNLGEAAGEESATLTGSQMPSHTHTVAANTAAPTLGTPAGNLWAQGSYSASGVSSMAAGVQGAIGLSGNNQPHPNLSPYLVVNFCIALSGIFPSRN